MKVKKTYTTFAFFDLILLTMESIWYFPENVFSQKLFFFFWITHELQGVTFSCISKARGPSQRQGVVNLKNLDERICS